MNRDDSPPAGPQFLSRTPGVLSQQYAAVTSVAFATRSTISPVLPPSMDFHVIIYNHVLKIVNYLLNFNSLKKVFLTFLRIFIEQLVVPLGPYRFRK